MIIMIISQIMDVCLQTFLVSLRLISLLSARRSASFLAETKERADVKNLFWKHHKIENYISYE